MRISDWSSDVCSSDLCDFGVDAAFGLVPTAPAARARVIARLDLRRARRAADRGVTFGLQRVARQVVRLEIGVEHLARPVDRKSVGSGKRVSVRGDLGGRRVINKQNNIQESRN